MSTILMPYSKLSAWLWKALLKGRNLIKDWGKFKYASDVANLCNL